MPGKSTRINVHCVHQSKPTQKGAEMKYSGRAPFDVDLSSQGSTWDSVSNHNAVYLAQTGRGDRIKSYKHNPVRRSFSCNISDMDNEVLPTLCDSSEDSSSDEVDAAPVGVAGSCGPSGLPPIGRNRISKSSDENIEDIPASDDLVDALDDMTAFIKEVMKKIPPIENQVGAIFLHENKIRGVDVYDLPASWNAVKEDVVAKEGSSYLKKEEANIFEFKPEMIKKNS